ncbi:MAG: STAS domain-containing protein [Prevotella sp.]|jgi:anti-anti-sigma factor|nr:STAS domain-containing protein [Prevotella sp.]
MNINIKERNGSYLGTLTGWIDTAVATQFLEDLKPLMSRADKSIELDCGGLDYICSLGLRGLLQLKKESVAKGGSLVLTHVEGEVLKIFTMTGFIKLFDIR